MDNAGLAVDAGAFDDIVVKLVGFLLGDEGGHKEQIVIEMSYIGNTESDQRSRATDPAPAERPGRYEPISVGLRRSLSWKPTHHPEKWRGMAAAQP
jgi:hypothetical protein